MTKLLLGPLILLGGGDLQSWTSFCETQVWIEQDRSTRVVVECWHPGELAHESQAALTVEKGQHGFTLEPGAWMCNYRAYDQDTAVTFSVVEACAGAQQEGVE